MHLYPTLWIELQPAGKYSGERQRGTQHFNCFIHNWILSLWFSLSRWPLPTQMILWLSYQWSTELWLLTAGSTWSIYSRVQIFTCIHATCRECWNLVVLSSLKKKTREMKNLKTRGNGCKYRKHNTVFKYFFFFPGCILIKEDAKPLIFSYCVCEI